MKDPMDFVILDPSRPSYLSYAGLVLEMLGYVRWTAAPGPGRVGVGESGPDSRSEAAPGAALLEATGPGERVPLPCAIELTPPLEHRCGVADGLYTHLENYNGIRGIRRPFSVPRPFWVERPAPRPSPPPAPGLPPLREPEEALAVPGEPLVRTPGGAVLAARRGNTIHLGLPLLSLIAAHLAAPPFPPGAYRFSEPVHHLLLLLDALIDLVAPPGVVKVLPWPGDAPGVVSLRHDLDRPADLESLWEAEGALGFRPSLHVLRSSPPPLRSLDPLRRIGGEIGFHAARLDTTRRDVRALGEELGWPVCGQSAHGGRDAHGWIGWLNLLAAHEAGLEYTELLSEMQLWPHRVPDLREPGRPLHPIALPHHLSFDLDRRAHDGARLEREVPRVLCNRGHLTIMNHPDLHREPFLALLAGAIPRSTLRLSLGEVARWWRLTHTRGSVRLEVDSRRDGTMAIRGRTLPGQEGAVLRVRGPDRARPAPLRVEGVTLFSSGEEPPGVLFQLPPPSGDEFLLEVRWE